MSEFMNARTINEFKQSNGIDKLSFVPVSNKEGKKRFYRDANGKETDVQMISLCTKAKSYAICTMAVARQIHSGSIDPDGWLIQDIVDDSGVTHRNVCTTTFDRTASAIGSI